MRRANFVTGLLLFIALVGGSHWAEASPIPSHRARPLPESIPIQIVNTNAGRVMTASAKQYGDTVYVSGRVFRPMSLGITPHVHVWGIDANNHQVFFKTAYVFFTGKPSFEHSETYQVSVRPEIFAKAKTVFVTFHSQGDAESTHEDY